MTTAPAMRWHLQGHGYEFCNCAFGCGCNFGGFPNSKDGSCHAFVGHEVARGGCGEVDLSGLKFAMIMAWPKAIHEGNGRAVLVVDPAAGQRQVDALAEIVSGRLGGNPWALMGPTFRVAAPVKAKITIEGQGRRRAFRAEGVGEGRGDTLKNPVTGEDHLVDVSLPQGFIWKKGECGQGSFRASAAGVSVTGERSNWISYGFDWSNA
jgi:hypothetical protein